MKIQKLSAWTKIIHWAVYSYFLYLFGYASLFKIFQKESMMDDMQALGFNETWTLLIGYGELLGVIGLITGIWLHKIKNVAVIWLFPFAIGALMVHFSHHDYQYFYGALFGCISSVILLLTDKHFKIKL